MEEELWISVHMADLWGANSKKSHRLSVPVHPFLLNAILTSSPQAFYRARSLSPVERKRF